WEHGRKGRNLAHLKAKLGLPDKLVIRDLERMIFDGAPVADWDGESMQQVFMRLQRVQQGQAAEARSEEERVAFDKFPAPTVDDVDFMLHLLREYDKSFRWWVDVGNKDNRATLGYLLHPSALPGFNDSGAHLTNMAFFDGNLMSLKLAQAEGLETVATMVRRLTREPAAFFGLDVGSIEIGAQADITLIDPAVLQGWDSNDHRELIHRELFDHKQMVNRSEGVVTHVLIHGEPVWQQGDFTDVLGSRRLGRALRAA
ncbi:MAG: amidohydrolase family protein, partial [Haliea sp.]|nr:amidohydrolase family protein [Haliea sp.]